MKKFYCFIILIALLVSTSMAQDVKKVLVMVKDNLTDEALPGVKSQVDAIKSINGFTWEFTYMVRSDIKNFSDFGSYDLAFMTENPGSAEASYWGLAGVKALPTLCYKAYAILASNKNWPWVENVNSLNNWWVAATISNTDAISETKVKVIANHAILSDLGLTTGGTFSLATTVGATFVGKAKIQTFNITDDANIVANTTAVGTSNFAAGSSSVINLLYAIEENPSSKRTVVLGTHQGYLENPTVEMNKLTTGAVKWLLKLGTTGMKDNKLADFNTLIYPNPTNQIATVSFRVEKASIVDIVVMNALGKTVSKLSDYCSNGIYNKQVDVSNFAKGLYFVKIRMNGMQSVNKLLVE
jgi:hypothetical protein